MLVAKSAIRAFLARELDSFAWMKKLNRDQLLRELVELHPIPRFQTEPWLHQLVCFYIGICYPRFIFHLDMGLGKTKIILDLIRHQQRAGRLQHALVGVPRLINIVSWLDDVERHSTLEPNPVIVEDIDEKWRALSEPQGDLTIIDYQGLALATCKKKCGKLVRDDAKIKKLQRIYNFIDFDELHKLRNDDSLWFNVADHLSKHAEFVYGNTGTLFGRKPEVIWPQFYLIDRGETFGTNKSLFRASFFTAKQTAWAVKWEFNRRSSRELQRFLDHRSLRYDDREVHDLPKVIALPMVLDMGAEQREHYLRAVQGVIDARSAGGDASTLEAPWIRMRQIVSGYLKWSDAYGDHLLEFKDNPKLQALESVLDQLDEGQKIIICYDYTDTGRMISNFLNHHGIKHEWYYGGTKDKPGARRRFMEDPECVGFVMNSEAGGTGTDGLQKVCHVMFFFENPAPFETRKQTVKRIDRPGQEHRPRIYDPIFRKTVDQGIIDNHNEGRDLYEDVIKGRGSQAKLKGFLLGS